MPSPPLWVGVFLQMMGVDAIRLLEKMLSLLGQVGQGFGIAFWHFLAHCSCPQTEGNLYLLPNEQHQAGRKSNLVKKQAVLGRSLSLCSFEEGRKGLFISCSYISFFL